MILLCRLPRLRSLELQEFDGSGDDAVMVEECPSLSKLQQGTRLPVLSRW